MDERCETCRYFLDFQVRDNPIVDTFNAELEKVGKEPVDLPAGQCRRYPPVLFAWPTQMEFDDGTEETEWEPLTRQPYTEPDNWCGEYQPADKPT